MKEKMMGEMQRALDKLQEKVYLSQDFILEEERLALIATFDCNEAELRERIAAEIETTKEKFVAHCLRVFGDEPELRAQELGFSKAAEVARKGGSE